MFTGIDYVLYTHKRQELFIQEMKKSFSLWNNPLNSAALFFAIYFYILT